MPDICRIFSDDHTGKDPAVRQRKAKDLDKRLRECSDYIVPLPEDGGRSYGEIGSKDPNFQSPEHEAVLRQLWKACFPRQRDLYLEIGCGKGDFITRKAAKGSGKRFSGHRRAGNRYFACAGKSKRIDVRRTAG